MPNTGEVPNLISLSARAYPLLSHVCVSTIRFESQRRRHLHADRQLINDMLSSD